MNEFINKDILDYVELNSQQEPTLLKELNKETHLKILNPRMLCSSYQGRVLSIISKIIKPKKVLEIGTYTGYSALCIAEGLDKNGIIHTIDINEELKEIQNKYFKKSGFENQIHQHIGNAIEIIPKINECFDFVYLDADKENYDKYFDLVIDKIVSGGVLISDNVLWSGKVLNNKNKDLITQKLIEFNQLVKKDKRLDTIILPIRDGISISRKI
ncbi:MAG: O-methyltransferase [Flavobacteriaceae bacterium]|jgi:predicted O-methyltransferase YrrM|nr:O-methyltransferase [Flavobacteriaceae bacterium]MBT3753837.1 O-methyltransferase [Flavobacteriaceae bacterium]MBT4062829.1 O-methyltransferase [Flavobacteriaceae bacterium]MBT4415509.1 O-methyltransferase [Flavobacteriaceae bacterium]MBT5012753.1 O-methyltransferase [Flavobacteriaceae bacterium]